MLNNKCIIYNLLYLSLFLSENSVIEGYLVFIKKKHLFLCEKYLFHVAASIHI